MDPNATLAELLEIAHHPHDSLVEDSENLERMAELVLALDGWLSQGGFRPARWQRNEPRPRRPK